MESEDGSDILYRGGPTNVIIVPTSPAEYGYKQRRSRCECGRYGGCKAVCQATTATRQEYACRPAHYASAVQCIHLPCMTYGHNCHAWGMSKQNRQLSSAIVVLGESAGSSPRHNSPQRRCSASPGKTVLVGSSRYEPANYLTRGGERARDKANEEKLMKLNKAAMKVNCLDKQLPVATCSHKAQYDDAADPSAAASTPARSIYKDRR